MVKRKRLAAVLSITGVLLASAIIWVKLGIQATPAVVLVGGLAYGVLSHQVFDRPTKHTFFVVAVALAASLILEIVFLLLRV